MDKMDEQNLFMTCILYKIANCCNANMINGTVFFLLGDRRGIFGNKCSKQCQNIDGCENNRYSTYIKYVIKETNLVSILESEYGKGCRCHKEKGDGMYENKGGSPLWRKRSAAGTI